MNHLRETIAFYRARLEVVRRTHDFEKAHKYLLITVQIQLDLEETFDTDDQGDDYLLGWVRQRGLELDFIDEQLREHRPQGIEMLCAWVADLGTTFERARTAAERCERKVG